MDGRLKCCYIYIYIYFKTRHIKFAGFFLFPIAASLSLSLSLLLMEVSPLRSCTNPFNLSFNNVNGDKLADKEAVIDPIDAVKKAGFLTVSFEAESSMDSVKKRPWISFLYCWCLIS